MNLPIVSAITQTKRKAHIGHICGWLTSFQHAGNLTIPSAKIGTCLRKSSVHEEMEETR